MYTCLFLDLHVSLPFDKSPTQIHPNTWASIQAFRLLCDVLRLHPSPSSFLSYYTSHPASPVSWHSLISRSGSVLFNSFFVSYKRFKERFVKVITRPKATTFFFEDNSWSRFPLYWTSQPRDFKEWPRLTGSADEIEILSFLDELPRKLPTRKLIGAYTKSARWATVKDTSLYFCYRSVYRPVLGRRWLLVDVGPRKLGPSSGMGQRLVDGTPRVSRSGQASVM